jgi:hypothetical protein
LGRYFVGLKPLSPGYKTYELKPDTEAFEWFDATLPLPDGEVRVSLRGGVIKVLCNAAAEGKLLLPAKRGGYTEYTVPPGIEFSSEVKDR